MKEIRPAVRWFSFWPSHFISLIFSQLKHSLILWMHFSETVWHCLRSPTRRIEHSACFYPCNSLRWYSRPGKIIKIIFHCKNNFSLFLLYSSMTWRNCFEKVARCQTQITFSWETSSTGDTSAWKPSHVFLRWKPSGLTELPFFVETTNPDK